MTSREEQLLEALANGTEIDDFVPVSRIEAYLKNCCLACGCDGLPAPITATDALLYKLAEQLADGGSGGGGNAAKLIFETAFTVDESLIDASKTTVATIQTGLTQEVFEPGRLYYAVIICTNDTDTDFSYAHFKERVQIFCDTGPSGYMSAGIAAGICYYIKTDGTLTNNYASSYGLYISAVEKYVQSITLQATCTSGNDVWGVVCSGDYRPKVFKLDNAFFGVEGLGDA